MVAFVAANILTLLALVSLWREKFQFWPPPSRQSWQYHTFWALFRIMFVGIVLLSFTDFRPASPGDFWWRYYLGGSFTVAGFLAAFLATHNLGWRNAHGEKKGLQTDGWYRWSRNPVYVVTIVGMGGLGLIVFSWRLWAILFLWSLLYVIAPFLEERWLSNQYGDAFLAYKREVPRFLGVPNIE